MKESAKKAKADADNSSKRKGKKGGRGVPADTKPLIVTTILQLSAAGSDNWNVKVFEDVRSWQLDADIDDVAMITASDGLSRDAQAGCIAVHTKWLKRQVKGGATHCANAYRPQVQKSVNIMMKKHVETLFTSFPAPSEFDTLCDDIFNPQGWAISEDHAHLAPAPFGGGSDRTG